MTEKLDAETKYQSAVNEVAEAFQELLAKKFKGKKVRFTYQVNLIVEEI